MRSISSAVVVIPIVLQPQARRELMMRTLLMLMLCSASAVVADAKDCETTSKVEVDGQNFKMRIKGIEAKVSPAAHVVTNTRKLEYHQKTKKTAEIVSGCKVVDSFLVLGRTKVAELSCPY
jgi:hypothetical protein